MRKPSARDDAQTNKEPKALLQMILNLTSKILRYQSKLSLPIAFSCFGLQHKHRLIGAWDHGFRNSDELILLIEHAYARRFPLAGIELRGRTLRDFGPARLNLRKRDLKTRTVTHAAFDKR